MSFAPALFGNQYQHNVYICMKKPSKKMRNSNGAEILASTILLIHLSQITMTTPVFLVTVVFLFRD